MDGPDVERWIRPSVNRTAEPAVRLFCFAHAGGGTAFFHPWRDALGPRVDTRPVVLPGRESRFRERPFRRIGDVLDPLCAALECCLDQPYALFGHSMGAIVAYEVARRLTRTARGPAVLVVSGRRAPHLPSRRPPLSGLPADRFLDEIAKLGGTPPEVLRQPQLVRLLLPPLRADFELTEAYRPSAGGRLDCPVVAYQGADDPEVCPSELLGWRERTTGEFTLRVFSGDHFYLAGARPDVLSAVRHDVLRAVARTDVAQSQSWSEA